MDTLSIAHATTPTKPTDAETNHATTTHVDEAASFLEPHSGLSRWCAWVHHVMPPTTFRASGQWCRFIHEVSSNGTDLLSWRVVLVESLELQ